MQDLETKNDQDLARLLHDKREALRAFRFGIAGSKVRNVREGRALRLDIARILTLLKKREANNMTA